MFSDKCFSFMLTTRERRLSIAFRLTLLYKSIENIDQNATFSPANSVVEIEKTQSPGAKWRAGFISVSSRNLQKIFALSCLIVKLCKFVVYEAWGT